MATRDARLRELGTTYREYLAGPYWAGVRARYRASGMPQECLACGAARFQLHHRSYQRLGCELLTDLVPLCAACHTLVHEASRETGVGVAHTPALLRRALGWSKALTREKFRPYEFGANGAHAPPALQGNAGRAVLMGAPTSIKNFRPDGRI
jgi:hypothetical protein